jgi:Holliday junction resolvase
MAKARNPNREQSTHNRKVQRLSRELKKEGYAVRADIRGYQRPRPIGKSKARPDIVAKKSGTTRIVEVETPKSLVRDKEQLKTFVRSAAHRKRTTLDIVVTKPRKPKRS